jgi:Ser/Thr protein kinase RdoA (MazF antagonist)
LSAYRWTDELREPLATLLRERECDRVEEDRDSGWLVLATQRSGADSEWYRAADTGLEPLDPLKDRRLKHLPEAVSEWLRRGWSVRLLAWRVGSRAIFRLESEDGPRIAKLYRKDRQILARWRVLPHAGSTWTVPAILDWDRHGCVLSLEHRDGESFNRRWLDGRGSPGDGDRIADVLEWLAGTAWPDGFPVHDVEDEVRILTERLEVFERTLEDPPPRARALTTDVVEALRAAPPGSRVLCHRDFHDKQLLRRAGGGSLIDLDLAAIGPPALDVGNILAHVRLRALKGAAVPWREIAGRLVTRAVPARQIESTIHRWTAASLLRLTLIYARRRRRRDLIDGLLASTEQALARGGEWRGIV